MKQYTYTDFKIKTPPDWMDETEVLLVGQTVNGFRPTVVVAHDQLKIKHTPRSYAGKELPFLRQSMGGDKFEMLDEADVTISGEKAFKRHYNGVISSKEIPVTQIQIYIIKNSKALIITATDSRDNFNKSRPVFEDIFKSVTIF